MTLLGSSIAALLIVSFAPTSSALVPQATGLAGPAAGPAPLPMIGLEFGQMDPDALDPKHHILRGLASWNVDAPRSLLGSSSAAGF